MNKLVFSLVICALFALAAAHWEWQDDSAVALSAVPLSAEAAQAKTCRKSECSQWEGNRCARFALQDVSCADLEKEISESTRVLAYITKSVTEAEEDEATVLQNFKASDYITDITVVLGKNTACPNGYDRYNLDLNKGAGGDYVWLCYQKGGQNGPITDITVISNPKRALSSRDCPQGYQFIDVDLNKNAGGDYAYFCFTRNQGAPVVDILFVTGRDSFNTCPRDYVKNSYDLNKSAGGEYIYLCYRKFGDAVSKVQVYDVKYDLSALKSTDESLVAVDQIEVEARRQASETQTLSGQFTQTTTKKWEMSNSATLGVAVEMSVGIPLVAESKVTVSASYTFTYTNGQEQQDSKSQTYTLNCKAEAKTKVRCTAEYRKKTVNIPYKATRKITYANGKTTVDQITGTYQGVAASSLYVNTKVIQRFK